MSCHPSPPVRVLCFLGLLLITARAPLAVAQEAPAPPLCVVQPAGSARPALTSKLKKKLAAHLEQAGNAYQSREFVATITALQAAYEIDPQIDILFNMAQACREAGRNAEAIVLYEKTLAESKDDATRADCERHIEGLQNKIAAQEDERAGKLLLDKEYSLAIRAWESAYQRNKNPAFLFHIAQAQRLGGQIDDAIAGYQKFIETAPENAFVPEAREHVVRLRAGQEDGRALKLFEAKKYDDAIKGWEAAHQISPQPLYLFRIAESQRLGGNKKAALAGYDRFLKETPAGELPELRQQATEQSLAIRTGTEIGRNKPVYKRWWFWTLIGGAVAGAVVGGVVGGVLSRPTDPFASLPPENTRTISPQIP